MDEASVLIATLQSKLRELDHKVLLYRRDMASEFTKHSESLLRDVAPEVAATVATAVAEGMGTYTSLVEPVAAVGKAAESQAEGGTPASQIAHEVGRLKEQGKLTPPPPPPPIAVGGTAVDADIPRSPHARESEFLGVFTQGYLPLLDSTDKHERRSVSDASQPIAGTPDRDKDVEKKAEQAAANLSASYSPPPRKPEPRRRETDDSGTMSDPENPVRRSALRRRSSSNKANALRRVRFEFAGQEFPTTSSPSIADTSLLPTALDSMPASTFADEDEEAEVEQVEDIDEEAEPKRISSSQALRILSRGPIEDDGTTWDEVRAPADGSASVSVDDVGAALSDEEEDFVSIAPRKSSSQSPNGTSPIAIPTASTPPRAPEPHQSESNGPAAEEAEQEDILSEMAPLAPMHSTRGVASNNSGTPAIPIRIPDPTNIPSTSTSTTSAPTSTQSPAPALAPAPTLTPSAPSPSPVPVPSSKGKSQRVFDFPDSDSEDDFFTFDDAPPSSRPPRPARAPSPDSSSSSSSTPVSPVRGVPVALSTYATSPARDIVFPKRMSAVSAAAAADDGDDGGAAVRAYSPTTGTATAAPVGSLRNSSYHPFAMPIVSPAVHEEARRMGEVSSFVGSLRDGMSIASVGWEGGRPRSFSERLAMEEWAEREREKEG